MKNNFPAEKLEPMLEHLGLHFEKLTGNVQRKGLEGNNIVLDTTDENCVIAKISTINIDRSGDIMIPEGCITDEFEQNPVVIVNHDYSKLPVAKIIQIQKTSTAILAKIQFSSTPMAQEVLKLVKEGILRSNSVGFVALETLKRGTVAFTKYVNDHFNGVVDKACKQIITSWKLLENSLVTLPCNKDALVLAVSKGLIVSEDIKKMFNIDEIPEKVCDNPISSEPAVNNEKALEIPETILPVVVTEEKPTIIEQVEHIKEEVKDVIKDVETVVETVIEEVKPVIERFINLVHPPIEDIKKSLKEELIKKKFGKIS